MASLYRLANATPCLRLKTAATFAAFPKYYSVKKSIISSSTPAPMPAATTVAAVGLRLGAANVSIRAASTATLAHKCGFSSAYMLNRNFNICHLNVKAQLPPHQAYRQLNQQQQQLRNFSSLQIPLQSQPTKLVHQNAMAPLKNRRYISSKEITKNMTLFTNGHFKSEVDQKTLELKKPSGNPLVLMMAWLMAKQKHLKKYAEIYTEMGFDVVVVHITPWQLLWPVKGTQIVAAETLKFLESNKSYAPIVVHGFSVGAYQFGEIMLQMARDMDRYSQVLNRMVCQIWDSAADITEIPVGIPKSIFPKNQRMQSALRNYTLYHLKTFHNQATIHYMRSSQMFHSTLLKSPALFFVCENDLIGPPSSNNAVRENWERANIKVTFKCWERSLHAAHLIKHRDEYLELLCKHLENTGVLESIGVKSRAKL